MFLSGLEVIIRSLHHWSTYLWIIKAGDPSGWNTVRVTDSAHRATAQQGWALSPVCRAQWERKWLQETCQIQVTLITPLVGSRLLLGHSSSRTNQINSKVSFYVRMFSRCGWTMRFMVVWDFLDLEGALSGFQWQCLNLDLVCYCFGWHIVISFACFLFLSMLVIEDICSSLPQPVQKQLSALKYGIDLVLSCYVKFCNGK